jgi:hypothetical protein
MNTAAMTKRPIQMMRRRKLNGADGIMAEFSLAYGKADSSLRSE